MKRKIVVTLTVLMAALNTAMPAAAFNLDEPVAYVAGEEPALIEEPEREETLSDAEEIISDAEEASTNAEEDSADSAEISADAEEVSGGTAVSKGTWDGPVLTPSAGVVMGPSGKETYYNLDMSGIVAIMRDMGNKDEYWIREDGCKMLGDYIMCAANLNVHPRGSLVESSLGTCIVCDTGGFAAANPNQLDIAVNW